MKVLPQINAPFIAGASPQNGVVPEKPFENILLQVAQENKPRWDAAEHNYRGPALRSSSQDQPSDPDAGHVNADQGSPVELILGNGRFETRSPPMAVDRISSPPLGLVTAAPDSGAPATVLSPPIVRIVRPPGAPCTTAGRQNTAQEADPGASPVSRGQSTPNGLSLNLRGLVQARLASAFVEKDPPARLPSETAAVEPSRVPAVSPNLAAQLPASGLHRAEPPTTSGADRSARLDISPRASSTQVDDVHAGMTSAPTRRGSGWEHKAQTPPSEISPPDAAPIEAIKGARIISSRAYSFHELGMFGLRAASTNDAREPSLASTQGAAVDHDRSDAQLDLKSVSDWRGSLAGSFSAATQGVPPGAYETDLGTPETVSEDVTPGPVQSLSAKPQALAEAEQTDVLRPAAIRETKYTEPRKWVAAATLSVLISEHEGEIEIVAASPEITVNACAKLLEAATGVGDEFGLSVSDFRHNGISIGSGRSESKGGPSAGLTR